MAHWLNIIRQSEALNRIRMIAVRQSESLAGVLLLIWACFVFFRNITSYPVETDEALYAAVGRQIARTDEWFRLEHEGAPFFYKPPLHFWLIAIAIRFLGENDFAARFPSATWGLATTVLVYVAGRQLFRSRTAVTAALIATTTYNLLWLAPQAKMDVELGFWLNLAVFGFLRGFQKNRRQNFALLLSFFSMTIATLFKGPIGVLLPGFTGLVLLLATRKSRTISEVPGLAIGLALVVAISSIYYLALGPDFNQYFFVVENLKRITEASKPFYFYFGMIFADLFPWSVFIPAAAIALWKSGLLKPGTNEFAALIWLLSFFIFLSVPSYKEEDFLVYLVPPFALLMARSWEYVLSGKTVPPTGMDRCLRGALILLSCATLALALTSPGPKLLQPRAPGFPKLLGASAVALVAGICLSALYVALRRTRTELFYAACVLATTLTFGFAEHYRFARGQYNRVPMISNEVRAIVGNSPLVVSYTQGSVEFLYYLDRRAPVPLVDKEKARKMLRSDGKLFALLLREVYEEIKSPADIRLHKLAEYTHRDWRYVLVSN